MALAREGYDLALTELSADALKDTLADPDIRKRKAVADRARPALAGQHQGGVRARHKELGDIDLLVNNAGRALLKPVVDVTDAEWDDVIDTNLKGAFFLSQLFGRACIAGKRPGVIVSMASTHGMTGIAGRSVYGISKAGPDPDDADAGDRMGRQQHPRQRHRADHGDDGIAAAVAERSGQARTRRWRAFRRAASPRRRKSPPRWSIWRAPARPR